MNDQTKLILALMQIENLIVLLKENQYEMFLYSKLYKMKYELQRQLSCLTSQQQSSIIKE